MNPESLLRAHVRSAPAYTPIVPFDVLSQQVGVPVEQIVKLDANENPYGMPSAIRDHLGRLEYAHIYPDPECRRLRALIAERTDVSDENLLVGAGADELIDLIMRIFLEPGECILNAPPTFGMYAFDAGINDARVISVPRRENFSLDVEAIENAVIASKPKLLFLASPNNPDGSLVSQEDLGRLLELPIIVVLDEAYIEFAKSGQSAFSLPPERNNLIVLRTFSKWAGLAGLRVGYGSFPGWLMPFLWKIKQPYNVSVAGQEAAIAALSNRDILDATGHKIIQERKRLFTLLKEVKWLEPYPSEANFILCRVSGKDAADVRSVLAQKGIFIRYFNKPGLADHIRISVGKPKDTDRLMMALRSFKEL